MKFTTTAGEFADALARVSRVIPNAPTLSVFSGARLHVDASGLSITGSDEGETTITVKVNSTDLGSGSVILLPKPIAAFLKTLPHATQVAVHADEVTKITVSPAGGNPYSFRVMDSTFPAGTGVKSDTVDVDLSRLGSAVAAVKDCARKNKIVQLISDETGLRLHATDNLRLARAHLPEAGFGAFSGLVPLAVLEQMGEAGITQLQVDRKGRVLTAVNDHLSIQTRLVNEMFPTVDSILSSDPAHRVLVQATPLRAAFARLGSITEDKQPLVVTIAGDEITLKMSSVNLGSGLERVELVTPTTTEVTFGVNMEFLAAAVHAHASADVELAWTAAEMPIFVKTREPLPVTTVIMPVKLA